LAIPGTIVSRAGDGGPKKLANQPRSAWSRIKAWRRASVAANSGLLRLQKGLEIRFANEFPGAGQEIVGFGWPIERDHFAEGIDVAQFDREFHGRVEADGKGMRHLHRVVIAEGREVFFNCPVVGRDAALAVFLISGQAEQDAHEFDTRVDAGTPGLRAGGDGASQQKS
jgi:hypothetical protein